MAQSSNSRVRVDFSLKREVFFVVIGAVLGAIGMIIPITFLYVGIGLPYYLTWMAFGHVIGVSSSYSSSATAGIAIHIITAISIGVATGVFLYKTGILNISKLSNGLLYGLLAGSIVFVLFFIPVDHFILAPEIARTINTMHATTTFSYGQGSGYETPHQYQGENNFTTVMIVWMIIHLIFGTILGMVSSSLSIKFGSRYRCAKCDISFSRIDSLQKHIQVVHSAFIILELFRTLFGYLQSATNALNWIYNFMLFLSSLFVFLMSIT